MSSLALRRSIEESGLTTVLSRASVEVAESEAGPQAGSVEIRTGARRSSQRGSRVIREGSETPLTLYSTEGSHEEDGVVSPLLDEQGFAAQQGQADPAAQEEGRADRSGSRRSRMSNLRHSLRRSMHINAPQNGDDNEMEELHSEGSELPTIPAEDAPSYELAIGTVASMPVAATSTENVATQEPSHETSTMSETSSPTNRRRAALRSIFMRHGPSPSVPSVSTPPQPALATPPRHQRCGSSGSVMTTCTSESGPRLSLSQTQSRPSFVGRARAFYASEAGASSMSLASSMLTTSGSPNATLGGRQISAPLRDTLVRSNYEYPRRGLTPEQLRCVRLVSRLVSQETTGTDICLFAFRSAS